MKTDGYDIKPWQGVQLDPPDVVFGADISDLRRYQGITLTGFASIPERDAAIREWIDRQERKPVIVAGPVVRSVEWGRKFRQQLRNRITQLENFESVMAPYPRDWYDDDANHEHSLLIYRERVALVTELIGSYRREIGVVLEQLEKLEHGG